MKVGDLERLNGALAGALTRYWHGEGSRDLDALAPRFREEPARSINFPCVRELVSRVRAGFPDIHIELEHSAAAAHALAQVWVLRGHHLGEFLGVPASGKGIEARLMSYHWLAGNRVVRSETTWELAGILAQIGALAVPPPTDLERGPSPEAPIPPPAEASRPAGDALGWPHEGAAVGHELHALEDSINRALAATWNDRDLSQAFALVHSSHRVKGMLEERKRGLAAQEYQAFHTSFCRAFPDVQLAYVSSLGDEEAMSSVTRFSGTHLGPFMGVPATGRRFSITTMVFVPHRSGLAAGAVNGMDLVGLLEQLGVVRVDPFEDLRVQEE